MSDERWIVVRNWDKFQHYSDRDAPWIKVYRRLLHDDDFLSLTDAARGVLLTIWLEFASAGGQLRARNVPSRMRPVDAARTLEALVQAGFIDIVDSKPSRARSREEKREGSSEPSLSEERAGAREPMDNGSRPARPEGEKKTAPVVCEACGVGAGYHVIDCPIGGDAAWQT